MFLSENVAVLRPTVPIPEEVDVQNEMWPNSASRNKAVHFTNSLAEKIAEDDPENEKEKILTKRKVVKQS